MQIIFSDKNVVNVASQDLHARTNVIAEQVFNTH